MKRGGKLKRSGFTLPSHEEAVEKAREARVRQRARAEEKKAQTASMERESRAETPEMTREEFLKAVAALPNPNWPSKAKRKRLERKQRRLDRGLTEEEEVEHEKEQKRAERVFRREVRKRDGNACQYPGCIVKQQPRQVQIVEVHHIGTRKRRPDLITVVTNGVCLCNFRTITNHHGWVHAHPIEAVEMGLLSDRSYELAAKEGTLGNY